MKIRAAVVRSVPVEPPYRQRHPVSVEQVELADPGPGEVLVRIRAAGLCHSDLSVINGTIQRPVPAVLGHEAIGTVEALGPGVEDLAAGDRVVTVFVPSCGRCLPCRDGRPALCEPGGNANAQGRLLSGQRRLCADGKELNHHLGISAFADHAVVSRQSLVPVAGDVSDEVAALFGCAVLTGVGAVVNTARVRPGESVAVVGLGGVGLSALLGAVASGASEIVAIDLSEEKLALASSLGATHVFNAAAPAVADNVVQETDGGVDHAFEMAGAVSALEVAFQVTRRGGSTTVAGIASPSSRFPLPIARFVSQQRTLRGSYLGSCVPARDVPRFMSMYRRGNLAVDRLLAATGPLEDINTDLDALAEGHSGRHVIVP